MMENSSLSDQNLIGEDDSAQSTHQAKISTCFSKCSSFIRNITVEPCIFLFILAISLQKSLTTNLLLEKTCLIYYNLTSEICHNLSSHQEVLNDVQRYANKLDMYIDLIQNIPGIFFVLVLGSWSDKHGRKMPMMLPFIGNFISSIFLLINVYRWDLSPDFVVITSIPLAFTGSFATFLMIMFSYITDVSPLSKRSLRISFVHICLALGQVCGLFLSSIMYINYGYYSVFGCSACLHFVTFLYILIRINETRGERSNYDHERELRPANRNIYRDLFSMDHLKQAIQSTFKHRENNKREEILAMILTLFLMVFAFNTGSLEFLYVGKKFNWDYSQYVNLVIAATICNSLVLTTVLSLRSYMFPWNENLFGFIGCLSRIFGNSIQAFAQKGFWMYVAIPISCMRGLPLVLARSNMSKAVSQDEIGKVFASLAIVESCVPLIAGPLFMLIYNSTLDVFPGAFYFVIAAFYLISAFNFLYVYFLRRGSPDVLLVNEE